MFCTFIGLKILKYSQIFSRGTRISRGQQPDASPRRESASERRRRRRRDMDYDPGAWSTFTSPSSDGWTRTMTTATSSLSSDDGWFSSMVFRLACAFWFVVGAAFGRATSGWFGGGGDRKRVRDASTSTMTATETTGRMNGERINDAEESSETTPARRLSGESTRADATETSMRSTRKSVGEGSRTTTMRDVSPQHLA